VTGADFLDPATLQNCAKTAFQGINPIIGNFPDRKKASAAILASE
jgi:hypothetical protein